MTEDQSKGKITQTIKSREPQITQATVLIESLLQQLCTVIEEDKVRRKKLYYSNRAFFLNTLLLTCRNILIKN